MKGRFFVFEGVDGSGKTSLIRTIKELHPEEKFLITSEPYCRERFLIDDVIKYYGYDSEECFEAMLKQRKAHIEEVLKPAVNWGYTVLCDRYEWSTYVYQHKFSRHIFQPDCYFLIERDFLTLQAVHQSRGERILSFEEIFQMRQSYNYCFWNWDVKSKRFKFRTSDLTQNAQEIWSYIKDEFI